MACSHIDESLRQCRNLCENPKDSGKRMDSELQREHEVPILFLMLGRRVGPERQTDWTYKLAASPTSMERSEANVRRMMPSPFPLCPGPSTRPNN